MKLYDKSGRVLALFLIIFLFPIGDSGEFPITTDTNHQKNPAIYGNIIIWVDYGDSSIDICAYNLITKEEFYITKNSSSQCAPDIYGNIVVWEDHRNGNSYIYGYNLCTNEEFQITENSDSQQKPAIHKDTIVWADSRNKNSDIFGYNLCTREEFQITTNPKNQHNPAIYGDIIVWDDDRNGKGDIYGYNLSTMEEFPIVVGPGSQYHPVIYGDIVVWVDGRNHNEDGSLDIYGYNVSTREEFQIAVGPSDQYEPAIYGNTVLWTDDRNGKPDIYCQNLSTQEEFQITTDPGRQQNSAICGNTIIWEDHRNWNFDIYGCSLPTSEEFQITTDRNKQTTPVIYGNTTVWVDYRNGNSDIYGYNLFAKEEFQISSDRSQQESPAIYGDIVVWEDYRNDNWDIYGYNLCAKEEFQITTDPGNQKHAAVYEDIVVWMDWRNGNENSDIYGFSLSTQEEFQITIAPDSQCYPAIYGDIVIWLDLRNSNWDIYGYNLSTKEEFGVVIDSSSQREPAIYENIVVWTYYRNGNSDIYGTDLSTRKEFQITTNDCEQDYPAIYENIIVWRDSRSGDSDIFGYNLSTKEEFQITTDRNHQESPAIYGDIVVWEDNRNGNSDIYGYSIFTIAYSTSPPTTTPPRNSIFKDPFLLAILSLIISLLALLTYFFGIDIKTIRKFLGKPKSGRKSNKDDQFNELVLSPDWFKKQAESQIANVKKKYLPGLHVEGLVDLKVHYLLGDQVFLKDLKNRKNEIITFITKIKKISEEIHSERLTANHQELLSDIEESFESSLRRIEERAQEIDEFIDLVSNAKFEESSQFNFSEEFSSETNALLSMLEPILKKRTEKVTFLPEERIFYEKLNEVAYELYSSFNYWQSLKEIITIFKQNELIILGRAGMGKTHLVCSFVDHRTKNGKPTILLFGNNFYRYHEIKTRIIELLGVPSDCHWEDLIIALEEAARASKSKLLFVIDGINESEDIRIWQTQLLGFFQYLKCSPWIIPIVTCRDTYVPRIFGDKEIQNTGYVYGFSNINEALEKYFNYFKIQPQLTFSSQEAFRHPLYLRILCDTYGDSSRKEPAVVDIREQNLYKVFDDYIRKCNEEIFLGSEKVDDDPNINHVQKALLSFGKEIWNSGKSYVPRSKAREIIDPIRPWSGNLFKAILEEGLLISRDFISYENEEVVDFTYDLLGDYVIAQSLLEGKTSHAIIESLQSLRELSPLTEQSRHPRLEGILRCLAVLLPEKTGKHLYCILPDFLSAQIASEEALFEMDPEFIDKEAKDWLSERFKSGDESGKRRILSQLINTAYVPDHPLGFLYIDQLLCTLTMSRRDLFWTEYIRENDEFLHDIIIDFEDRCMRGELGSDEQEFVIQEARLLRWILTSTN
jgi:beta propeller repeat protein